jgi:hypothetical protein
MEEYAEILRRHRCLLEELIHDSVPSHRRVLVVPCSWSGGPTPTPRSPPVAASSPGARHWRSALTDDSEPTAQIGTHLWVDELDVDDPGADQLLRLVADDRTSGVLITAPDFGWVYAPMTGADVHVRKPGDRDAMTARHLEWLPPHPSGLLDVAASEDMLRKTGTGEKGRLLL